MIERSGNNLAILINTFDFLQCRGFLKIKHVVNQLADCNEFGYKFDVDNVFWEQMEEIVSTLQPVYNLTIDMQRVGYGLADMFIGWLRVKKSLNRIANGESQFNLAAKLIEKMDQRASSLLKTPLLLCAVYLDPRIMLALTDEQKTDAAMDLVKIHERITDARRMNNEPHLDDTLDEIQKDFQSRQNGNRSSSDLLLKELSIFETEGSYDIRAPVMKFWTANADKYKLIRPLADLLHAVPSNQCCTECSFSSFSYIRSKHRMRMSPQNVSNVLMVRLNKDVYYSLRKERIQKIFN